MIVKVCDACGRTISQDREPDKDYYPYRVEILVQQDNMMSHQFTGDRRSLDLCFMCYKNLIQKIREGYPNENR